MLFSSVVFSASGIVRRLIASPAVPMTVDSEKRSGEKTCGRADVVAENLRGHERRDKTRDAEDDGQRHLGNGIALEPAKELRSDLVAGREQEQIEEDRLHERRNLDVELPDHDAGQQRPDHDAETEAAELQAPDQEADREREENRQFGIGPQPMYDEVHVSLPFSPLSRSNE